MDQPQEESKQTPESTHEENSTDLLTSDQPKEESQEPQQQTSALDETLDSLRKKYGIKSEDEDEDEQPKEKEKSPEAKSEKPTESKKTEEKEDVEVPDEIELDTGARLNRVQVADGIEIFVTPEQAEQVKASLMKSADYTQKTQKLAEERKQIDSAKSDLVRQLKEFQRFQEEIALASGNDNDDPEPLESEFVDPLDDEDTKRDRIREYRTKKAEWVRRNDERMHKRAEYYANVKAVNQENDATVKAFSDEFGPDALSEIYPELMAIRDALSTTGTKPFPKDMLRKYWLGHNFEKELQKRLQKETQDVVNKIDNGVKKSKQLRPGTTAKVVSGPKDGLDALREKYKRGEYAGGW